MQYKIGQIILDTKARTISDGEKINSIRPKTLELLLYLAEKKGQIISKEELLGQLWPDVKVDEGVVFQSITEIRKLLSSHSILNYPRRGYEFTETLSPFQPNKTLSRFNKLLNFKAGLLALFVILVVAALVYTNLPQPSPSYQHQIVVLPVKSHVNYANEDWQGVSGMATIIASLNSNSAVYIYPSDQIPTLLHRAGLNINQAQQGIERIFSSSGASLIVQTDVYGSVNNYNLVYKFHLTNDIKQGSLFDTSIDGVFSKLAKSISDFTSQPISYNAKSPAKEFTDALFVQAIVNYESDWQSSISFFESYLALQPKSIYARLYLSRLYLWQGKLEAAQKVIDLGATIPTDDPRLKAYIQLIQGQISAEQQQWQTAIHVYTQAHKLFAAHSDWSLKADILLHHGHALMHIQQFEQAYTSYKQALSYYQAIESPIGINTSRIYLAEVLNFLGKQQQAEDMLALAEQQIESQQLSFLYTLLAQKQTSLFAD